MGLMRLILPARGGMLDLLLNRTKEYLIESCSCGTLLTNALGDCENIIRMQRALIDVNNVVWIYGKGDKYRWRYII